jgi:hypothetical protein
MYPEGSLSAVFSVWAIGNADIKVNVGPVVGQETTALLLQQTLLPEPGHCRRAHVALCSACSCLACLRVGMGKYTLSLTISGLESDAILERFSYGSQHLGPL